jgi:tetratricopeptide (TPR) repeat protein
MLIQSVELRSSRRWGLKMKRNFYPVFICLAVILAVSCGRSKEDRAVNELIREASELVKLAERERGRKVTEAEYLEREALARLEQAVALHPSSPSAVLLLEGETRVGPYTFSELKEKVTIQQEALVQARSGKGEDPVGEVLRLAGDLAGRPGPLYYQSGVLARIAAAYSRRGQTPLAEEFFARSLTSAQLVEAPYYKILALSELAGQYVLAGREEDATELLIAARGINEKIEYPFFRSGAAAVIAARYLAIGREEEALEIIETIEEPYYLARIMLNIASRRIEDEMMDESSIWLSRAREVVDQIEDPIFRVEIITDCAGRQAQLGDAAALDLLNEAYALALTLDEAAPRAGALARVASWYGKLDRREEGIDILERAIAAAEKIEDNLFKDLALLEISESLAGMGEYDRVLEIIDLVEVPRFKVLCLVALSECCLAAGEEETAVEFADQARQTSLEVENPHFRAEILVRIARCLPSRAPGPLPSESPPLPSEEALNAPTPSGDSPALLSD